MENNEVRYDLSALSIYVKKWKISQPAIAKSIGMPVTTFKNKLNPKLPQYSFTEEERLRVIIVIRAFARDLLLLVPESLKNPKAL